MLGGIWWRYYYCCCCSYCCCDSCFCIETDRHRELGKKLCNILVDETGVSHWKAWCCFVTQIDEETNWQTNGEKDTNGWMNSPCSRMRQKLFSQTLLLKILWEPCKKRTATYNILPLPNASRICWSCIRPCFVLP